MRILGHYMGTEINEKWWYRYAESGFFARGKGEFWIENDSFFFQKYLINSIIEIPFEKVKELKTGTWHAGQWSANKPILKILWVEEETILSSGFLLPKKEIDNILLSF